MYRGVGCVLVVLYGQDAILHHPQVNIGDSHTYNCMQLMNYCPETVKEICKELCLIEVIKGILVKDFANDDQYHELLGLIEKVWSGLLWNSGQKPTENQNYSVKKGLLLYNSTARIGQVALYCGPSLRLNDTLPVPAEIMIKKLKNVAVKNSIYTSW